MIQLLNLEQENLILKHKTIMRKQQEDEARINLDKTKMLMNQRYPRR